MTRILSAAAIALAFTVGAGAQSQSYPDTTKKSDKAGKMSSKTVTLTGCLREGESPDTFALDNVKMSGETHHGTTGASTPSSSGTAGSTASSSASGASSSMSDLGKVKLLATADINLKEHVGHEVQVSGTLSGMDKMKDKSSTTSSDTTGSGSSASSSSATGTSGTAKNQDKDAHTLKVRSLRHISETCTT